MLIRVPQTLAFPVAPPYDEDPPPYSPSQPQGEGRTNEGLQVVVVNTGCCPNKCTNEDRLIQTGIVVCIMILIVSGFILYMFFMKG